MTKPTDYQIACIELTEWNTLVQQCGDFTVFHMLPWIMAIASANHLKIMLLGAWKGGQCAGVWPLLEMRKGFLRIIGSPLPGWSTPYLGPLFRHDLSGDEVQSVLSAFLDHPSLRRYSYFACKVVDRSRPVDMGRLGFMPVLRYDTYRLNLDRSEDQLWSGCRRECRNHVRKAQKNGVEIRFEPAPLDPSFVEDYWSMSIETFARAGVKPTHNRELIEQIGQRLVPVQHAVAISALHGGERIAATLLMCDDRSAYYWGGASRLKYRSLSPHNLLQWEAIRYARCRGMQNYDFISTTGGPGKFKESFGPERVAISTHWERSPSRLLMALKQRYKRYLEFRARVRHVNLEQADESKPVTPPACA